MKQTIRNLGWTALLTMWISLSGCAHLNGGGDSTEKWKKRAEQGDVRAQYVLGVAYSEGDGVPQDYQEALRWFRKAAEQGDPWAQHNLGHLYQEGKGVPVGACNHPSPYSQSSPFACSDYLIPSARACSH